MTLAQMDYELSDAIWLAGCAVNALCIANSLPPVILCPQMMKNVAASTEGLVIERSKT